MSLAALGVVYGDIGTSPLYAVSEIFFGHGGVELARESVLGGIGLVFWALTLVICIKYVFFVLRADNDGEGGVFALSGLVGTIDRNKSKLIPVVMALFVFAAGLLFGDGIITPAISVVSALEGLKVATPLLNPFVVPLAVVILTILFMVQRLGTAKVGSVFGPIIVVWLVVMGWLGLRQILAYPGIFEAINPIYAAKFLLTSAGLKVLLVLGSVMLCITGGEAMYADMGHFGKKPIRLAWFSVVYPMLLLNYFGQGAYLLSGQPVINENVFYSMVPGWALIPVVILAMVAAVIASQALISGVFSLTSQAINLGFLPRISVVQTHHEHEGQRYVPAVNWFLYVGSVLLVLLFKTSSNLASAYGLAVAGDMVITCLGLIVISRFVWKWTTWKILAVFGTFLIVDFGFLTANSLKLVQGGYVPLSVALVVFTVMKVWQWGRTRVEKAIEKYPTIKLSDLIGVKQRATEQLPRSVILMSPDPVETVDDKVPVVEQMFLERYGLVAEHIILLTVIQSKSPYMHGKRYEVKNFYLDDKRGSVSSVKMHFGFMEEPNVEKALEGLARQHLVHINQHHSQWLVHMIEDRVIVGEKLDLKKQFMAKLFGFMDKNSMSAVDYFGLGNRIRLSSEVLPVRVNR
jgi:KUP system potassium uptake protein